MKFSVRSWLVLPWESRTFQLKTFVQSWLVQVIRVKQPDRLETMLSACVLSVARSKGNVQSAH